MAAVLGAVIGIGGAISGAYGIVSLVRLGSCLGVCAEHTAVVPYLIGGILAVTASAFLWRWSMAVSPVAGLVAAGVLLQRQGAPNSNPADPQTRALLAEFGIHPAQAYGYDPTAATGLTNH